MISSTTPTSSGLAQVFDTSGLVQQVRQQKAQRDAELEKSLLEYDPDGLWDIHVPKFQDKYNNYMEFVSKNHDALVNPSDNIGVWQEKKKMENELKNFASFSQSAKNDYMSSLQMLANPKYSNDANRDLIYNRRKQITDADYESGAAFDTVNDKLMRNTSISMEKYMAAIAPIATESKSIDKSISSELKDANYTGVRTDIQYDEEKVLEILKPMYERDDDEGKDLRQDYETVEDFVQAVKKRMPTEQGMQLIRNGSDSNNDGLKLGDKQTTIFKENVTINGLVGVGTGSTTEKKNWIGKTKVSTETGTDEVNVDYDIYAGAVGVDGISNVSVSGNFGGFDISGGSYGETMFRDVTDLTLNQVGLADYARQPMYIRIQTGINDQQKPVYAIKEVKAGELVPKLKGMAGAEPEYFKSDGLDNVNQLYSNDQKNGAYAIGGKENEYKNFVGQDLYAFVKTTERVPSYDEESPVPDAASGGKDGTLTYRQGAIKWADAKHVFQPKLSTYAMASEQIARLEAYNASNQAATELSGLVEGALLRANLE